MYNYGGGEKAKVSVSSSPLARIARLCIIMERIKKGGAGRVASAGLCLRPRDYLLEVKEEYRPAIAHYCYAGDAPEF